MKLRTILAVAILPLGSALTTAYAVDHKPSDPHAGHTMAPVAEATDGVQAIGVINTIDVQGNMINVTHEPVAALDWPKMTMDLPVTRQVDLGTMKTGDKVQMTLKQGRDKQYRVVALERAP